MSLDSRDTERLAILETNTKNIEKLVIRLDGKLDAYVNSYVTKVEMSEAFKYRDEAIKELKDDQQWLRRTLVTTIVTGIASICAAAIMFLIKGS